jgi:uncharacterized protein YejL (UPF0352 family)
VPRKQLPGKGLWAISLQLPTIAKSFKDSVSNGNCVKDSFSNLKSLNVSIAHAFTHAISNGFAYSITNDFAYSITNYFAYSIANRFTHAISNDFAYSITNRFTHPISNGFAHSIAHRFTHAITNDFAHSNLNPVQRVSPLTDRRSDCEFSGHAQFLRIIPARTFVPFPSQQRASKFARSSRF